MPPPNEPRNDEFTASIKNEIVKYFVDPKESLNGATRICTHINNLNTHLFPRNTGLSDNLGMVFFANNFGSFIAQNYVDIMQGVDAKFTEVAPNLPIAELSKSLPEMITGETDPTKVVQHIQALNTEYHDKTVELFEQLNQAIGQQNKEQAEELLACALYVHMCMYSFLCVPKYAEIFNNPANASIKQSLAGKLVDISGQLQNANNMIGEIKTPTTDDAEKSGIPMILERISNNPNSFLELTIGSTIGDYGVTDIIDTGMTSRVILLNSDSDALALKIPVSRFLGNTKLESNNVRHPKQKLTLGGYHNDVYGMTTATMEALALSIPELRQYTLLREGCEPIAIDNNFTTQSAWNPTQEQINGFINAQTANLTDIEKKGITNYLTDLINKNDDLTLASLYSWVFKSEIKALSESHENPPILMLVQYATNESTEGAPAGCLQVKNAYKTLTESPSNTNQNKKMSKKVLQAFINAQRILSKRGLSMGTDYKVDSVFIDGQENVRIADWGDVYALSKDALQKHQDVKDLCDILRAMPVFLSSYLSPVSTQIDLFAFSALFGFSHDRITQKLEPSLEYLAKEKQAEAIQISHSKLLNEFINRTIEMIQGNELTIEALKACIRIYKSAGFSQAIRNSAVHEGLLRDKEIDFYDIFPGLFETKEVQAALNKKGIQYEEIAPINSLDEILDCLLL